MRPSLDLALPPAHDGDGTPSPGPANAHTLYESNARFREAFTYAAIGMALVSLDGQWLEVNAAVCHMLGYTGAELYALTFQDLTHPDDLDADLAYVQQLLAGAIPAYHMEKRYIHKDGHFIWALLSVSLVRDTLGQPLYFVSQIQDKTAQKQLELAAHEREAWFRALFEQSPDAVLLIDPHHPTIDWPIVDCNAAAGRMNGYHHAELIGRSVNILHPEPVARTVLAAFTDVLRDNGPSRLEVIHQRKDGTQFPILASSCLITIGAREYVLGIDHDMTALKAAEVALFAANQELSARVAELEEHMRYTKLLTDMGEWLHACQRIEEAADVVAQTLAQLCPDAAGTLALREADQPEAIVVTTWGVTHPSAPHFAVTHCPALRDRSVQFGEYGCRGCSRVPHVADTAMTLCMPLAAFGTTIGVLRLEYAAPEGTHAADHAGGLSELQQQFALTMAEHGALALANLQLRQSLTYQAVRDALTDLYNRRHMAESLTREIHRAQRRASGVGVIMLDIDHFKAFNDAFGHPAGDTLLRAVAGYLKSRIRTEDIACRYGGEEFLIIMADITLAALADRAAALHAGLAPLQIWHDDQLLGPVTVSIGLALFPLHGATGEEVIQAADAALYRAKQTGRNRIVIAQADDARPADPSRA